MFHTYITPRIFFCATDVYKFNKCQLLKYSSVQSAYTEIQMHRNPSALDSFKIIKKVQWYVVDVKCFERYSTALPLEKVEFISSKAVCMQTLRSSYCQYVDIPTHACAQTLSTYFFPCSRYIQAYFTAVKISNFVCL